MQVEVYLTAWTGSLLPCVSLHTVASQDSAVSSCPTKAKVNSGSKTDFEKQVHYLKSSI